MSGCRAYLSCPCPYPFPYPWVCYRRCHVPGMRSPFSAFWLAVPAVDVRRAWEGWMDDYNLDRFGEDEKGKVAFGYSSIHSQTLQLLAPLSSCLALTMPGQLNLNLAAVAFISSQNHPILVRALSGSPEDLLKYHYIAHTSLDVIDERS